MFTARQTNKHSFNNRFIFVQSYFFFFLSSLLYSIAYVIAHKSSLGMKTKKDGLVSFRNENAKS